MWHADFPTLCGWVPPAAGQGPAARKEARSVARSAGDGCKPRANYARAHPRPRRSRRVARAPNEIESLGSMDLELPVSTEMSHALRLVNDATQFHAYSSGPPRAWRQRYMPCWFGAPCSPRFLVPYSRTDVMGFITGRPAIFARRRGRGASPRPATPQEATVPLVRAMPFPNRYFIVCTMRCVLSCGGE